MKMEREQRKEKGSERSIEGEGGGDERKRVSLLPFPVLSPSLSALPQPQPQFRASLTSSSPCFRALPLPLTFFLRL